MFRAFYVFLIVLYFRETVNVSAGLTDENPKPGIFVYLIAGITLSSKFTSSDMNELLNFVKQIQPYAIGIVFTSIYLAEHIIPQRSDMTDHRHDLINLLIGLGNLIVVFGCGYVIQWCLTFLYNRHIGLLYYLPLWAQITMGLFLIDFFMYWWHRVNHQIPIFWYFHKFHHTDKKLNITTAIRFHTGELFFSYIFKLPFLALLGINPGTVVLYGLILLPVVTLNHSNIRIGKLTDKIIRKLFVSPQMHRIHHSVIVNECNSNYSSILPIWDRLFKSYTAKESKPIEFGV